VIFIHEHEHSGLRKATQAWRPTGDLYRVDDNYVALMLP